jgi:hypothetical protein
MRSQSRTAFVVSAFAVVLLTGMACTQILGDFEKGNAGGSGASGGGASSGSASGGGGSSEGGGGAGGSDTCRTPLDCDDHEPCTDDDCGPNGKCTHTNLSDQTPSPGYDDLPNDCVKEVCIGGVSTPVAVSADVPDDENDCTTDTCDGIDPRHVSLPNGTPCGDGQNCKSGKCGCDDVNDCPSDTFCRKWACQGTPDKVCVSTNINEDLPLPNAQTPQDCKEIRCRTGDPASFDDDSDPIVDGNLCTRDNCSSGVPSNPPEPQGTPCGGANVCDTNGNCCTPEGIASACGNRCGGTVVNNCGQTVMCSPSVCMTGQVCNTNATPDTCCTPDPISVTCAQGAGQLCGGQTLTNNCGQQVTCGSALCPGATTCVDGFCCNGSCNTTCRTCSRPGSEGTCVSTPPNQTDPPNCTGTSGCGGSNCACSSVSTCLRGTGSPCSSGSQCLSGVCLTGTQTCT